MQGPYPSTPAPYRHFRQILGVLLLSSVGLWRGTAFCDEVIVPRETIALFNGRDLSPFYTWLEHFGYSDPHRVFTVVDHIDGAPAIRISGEHLGGIITRNRYANYRLVAEFRWGLLTWAARINRARDAGIFLHCQGEDGNFSKDFRSPWIRSIELQIMEGATGDFLLLPGYDRGSDTPVSPRLTGSVRPGTRYWSPDGTPTELNNGRLFWEHHDPDWKSVLGFRGPRDVERPVGEWNRLEVICDSGNVTCVLNGAKVNEAKNACTSPRGNC